MVSALLVDFDIDIVRANSYSICMKLCLYCKTKEVSDKATYCSDKCRMAYQRRTKSGDLPEQIQPEHTRTGLTRTDSLFETYKPGYYKFGDTTHKETCLNCDKQFTTSLRLLRQCSPKCMMAVLTPRKVA